MTVSPRADLDWRGPSPKLGRLRHFEVAAVAIVAVALALGIGAAAGSIDAGAISAAASAAVALVADRMLLRRVRAWAYAEREEDLIVRRGLLFRRLSVVPYGRMQFIDVTAGPFERLMGLSSVQLHTAAAASDARIPGLANDEAHRLRDQLARLGESRAAGL